MISSQSRFVLEPTHYIVDRRVASGVVGAHSYESLVFNRDGKEVTYGSYFDLEKRETISGWMSPAEYIENKRSAFGLACIKKETWEKLHEKYKQSLITDPVEVSESRFYQCLEVIPPRRHEIDSVRGLAVFSMDEEVYHEIVTWFVGYGNRYFEMNGYDQNARQAPYF